MGLIFESYREFIPDFEDFQESLHLPIPTHIRINTLKAEIQHTIDSLLEKGILLRPSFPDDPTLLEAPKLEFPGNLLEYFLGHIHPQAFTSCLASLVLSPKKGAYVLDLCAAPGGKTSHVCQLMENTGLIVANELYSKRHVPLGHTLARLGVANTLITGYQAQEFPMRNRFDYILADVPCSGEGTFRKLREGYRYVETREKVKLPQLQKRILLRGFDLLRPGGVILYSTCTYNPDENEGVVAHLLENRDATLFPIQLNVPFEEGITEWREKKFDERLTRTARFYPHRTNSVGFFMAKLGKPGRS